MVFMRKIYLLFFLMLLTCFKGIAQISSYTRTALTGLTYTQITSGTVINSTSGLSSSMSNNDNDGAVLVNLPFTFIYNGSAFNQVTFCTNGWIAMGNQLSVSTADGKNSGNLFATAAPGNAIAAWFGDITANFPSGGSGSMVHGAYGTGAYAFEWRNAGGNGATSSTADLINFMVVLYGPLSTTPGRIELLYGSQSGTLTSGTSIGIKDATGGSGNYINAISNSSTSTTTSTSWVGNGSGYRFTPPACTGTPAPGNTLSTVNPVCPGQNFVLSLQNTTIGSGVTYQWQASPNGTTWTNIASATFSSLTTNQTATTYYRCGVTCSSNTTFSTSVLINMNTFMNCYCAASQSVGCGSNDVINNVTFGSINNTTTCTSVPSYTDYGSTVPAPNIVIGSTNPISISVGAGGTENVAVWIDYNQNGVFDATEYTSVGSGSGVVITNNITIPASAIPGLTKMRVRLRNTTAIANTDGCTTFTNGETEDYNVTLVCNTPTFTTHPSSAILCAGTNMTLTAAATGSGINYQWQVNTGTGFANITNGGVYSGATTGSLVLTAPPASFNGYQFRCIASVLCSSTTATSNTATLSLGNATAITSSPVNTIVCNGEPVSFSVGVSATNATYQWQVYNTSTGYTDLTNTGIYSNVNTATLNISAATLAIDGYAYRCVVGGYCVPNVVISGAATLTVGTSIPVTIQPVNTTICSGGTANLSVTTRGANVVYQWQVNTGSGYADVVNGTNYSGATTATLSVLNTPLSFNTYQYRCVLSNNCVAPFFTNAATLTVQPSPVIATQPLDVNTCDFQNVGFNVVATGTGISYQWQVNTGLGFVNLTNGAPYGGVLGANMSIANVTSAMNGYQYRCVVTGTCTPSVISNVVTLTITNRPVLVTGPVNATICDGGSTTFAVSATGTSLTYQWQINTGTGFTNLTNTGIHSGVTTNTLAITSATNAAHGNAYRCVVTGSCAPSVTSSSALLFINSAPYMVSQPIDKQVCAGSNIFFSVATAAATSANPLSYQWQVNTGTGFTNLTNTAPYSNVTTSSMVITGATVAMNGYRYRCLISNATCTPTLLSNAVMLTVNTLPTITTQPSAQTLCPSANATFSIAATGTGISYQWQVNAGAGFQNISGSAPYGGANTATVTITGVTPAMNGYQYRCVVKGDCVPSAVSNPVLLNVLSPVIISSNTITDTVCETGTVKLGVRVVGAGILYQWQRMQSNGSFVNLTNTPPYSGVNTDSLRISAAPASLNGAIYRCALTETQLCSQWYYTANIPLGVNPAPIVSPSALQTGPGKIATFAVPPTGTSYQWQENDNSGNGYRNLAEGGLYTGVYTNTLRVGPATLLMNGNMYRCIVDGVCSITVASHAGQLTVDPALSVTSIRNGEGIDVYPNPTSGNEVNISFKKTISGNTTLRVTDKLGKVVYTQTISLNNQNSIKLNLPDMAAGVYMLQVVSEQNNIAATVQFVKQ